MESPGGEGGEGGALAEVDAECALVSHVSEGYLERISGLANLIGLHGCADDVLFLVVSGAGSNVSVDGKGPLVFGGDRVNGVGADGDGGASEAELDLGEKCHGGAAGSPGLAVGKLVVLGGDGIVADVDLASIVEVTTGGG